MLKVKTEAVQYNSVAAHPIDAGTRLLRGKEGGGENVRMIRAGREGLYMGEVERYLRHSLPHINNAT